MYARTVPVSTEDWLNGRARCVCARGQSIMVLMETPSTGRLLVFEVRPASLVGRDSYQLSCTPCFHLILTGTNSAPAYHMHLTRSFHSRIHRQPRAAQTGSPVSRRAQLFRTTSHLQTTTFSSFSNRTSHHTVTSTLTTTPHRPSPWRRRTTTGRTTTRRSLPTFATSTYRRGIVPPFAFSTYGTLS